MKLEFRREFGPVYNEKYKFADNILREPSYLELDETGHELALIVDGNNRYAMQGGQPHLIGHAPFGKQPVMDRAGRALNFQVSNLEVSWKGRLVVTSDEQTYAYEYDCKTMPFSVQLLGDQALLSLTERHMVVLIDREGRVLWSFGTEKSPGKGQSVTAPQFAMYREETDTFWIADTLNCRVIEVDRCGKVLWQYGTEGQIGSVEGRLWRPSCIKLLTTGELLIADSRNGRVLCLNRDGELLWKLGEAKVDKLHLAFPRSVEELPNGYWLITNTFNNFLYIVNPDTDEIVRTYGSGQPADMHWPRCSTYLPQTDEIMVGDGRNNRILFLSAKTGDVVQILDSYLDEGHAFTLGDPHHIEVHPSEKKFLVTISLSDAVIEIDREGHLLRKWTNLNDPHSAKYMPDGGLLIADSGANQIKLLHVDGVEETWVDFAWMDGSGRDHFNKPRMAIPFGDEVIVLDSAAHRILLLQRCDGEYKGELIPIEFPEESPALRELFFSRWLSYTQENNFLLSDTGQGRIVELKILDEKRGNHHVRNDVRDQIAPATVHR